MTGTDTSVERALRLGSIEIAEDGIAECTPEGRRLVFVPRSGIERVTVVHGFTSERPIAALLVATLCLGGATAIVWAMIASFDHGNVRFVTVTPVLLLGVIGAMLLWTLVRRGRYLRVETARGLRKLLLHSVRDRDALRELLHVARSRWCYAVELASFDEAAHPAVTADGLAEGPGRRAGMTSAMATAALRAVLAVAALAGAAAQLFELERRAG